MYQLFRFMYWIYYLIIVTILHFISSEIYEATYTNIQDVLGKKDVILMNFYATWCPYSRMLEPIYEELDKMIQQSDIKDRVGLARLDGSNNSPITLQYNINHFPSLMVFRKKQFTNREYHGYRKLEDLFEFLKEIANFKPTEISDLSHVDNNDLNVVMMTPSITSPEYIIFEKLAEKFMDKCKFYRIISSQSPLITFMTNLPYQQRENYPTMTHVTTPALSLWLERQCNPVVREITFDNAESLISNQKPLFILFYINNDLLTMKEYVKTFENLRVILSKYNMVLANAKKFSHALTHVRRTIDDAPFAAFDDFKHIYYFGKYDDLKDVSKVIKFIHDYESGELHKRLHEEMQIRVVIQLDEPFDTHINQPPSVKGKPAIPSNKQNNQNLPKNNKPSYVTSLFKKLLPDSDSFSHVNDVHEL